MLSHRNRIIIEESPSIDSYRPVFGEVIVSRTLQPIHVERAIAVCVQVTDRSLFKLPGWVSWLRLTLQCNGRSGAELVPKTSSGRASGSNGQISVDQNSDTAGFGSANSFET
jgi:hypothetical protein